MNKEKKYILVLSARDKNKLKEQAKSLFTFLKQKSYGEDRLTDICYTLQIGRDVMESRVAFLVDTMAELVDRLKEFCEDVTENEYRYYGEGEVVQTAASLGSISNDEIARAWSVTGNVSWEELYKQQGIRPRVIGLPSYCFEKNTFWAPASTSKAIVNKQSDSIENLFYEELWKECHPLESTLKTMSGTIICFVPDKGYERIKAFLCQNGPEFKYVFVKQGNEIKNVGKNDYTVRPEYESFRQLFQMIQGEYTNLHGILYLWSLDVNLEHGGKYFEKVSELVKGVAISKIPFQKILITSSYQTWQERCFSETLVSMETAVSMILPETTVKVVCISTTKNEIENCMQIVLDEFHIEGEESVLYEDGVRKHLTLTEKKMLETKNTILKNNGVYCITGGMGGIGKAIAAWLLEEYQATVVLLGRTGKEQVASQVVELALNGGVVDYIQADVCDYTALEGAMEQIGRAYGTVNGIFHAAGLEGKKSILLTEREEFKKVLEPKVEGTLHLIQAAAGINYDFMCLCSSSSAMLGDFGNCAYSLGNRFLMLVSKYYDERIKVINWPLWKDGGMGQGNNEGQKMYLKSSGQVALKTQNAVQILSQFLNSPYKQILAMVGVRSKIESFLLKDRGQVQEKRTIQKPIVKHNMSGSTKRKSFMSDWTVEECVAYELKVATKKILQIEIDDMGEDENLADFGYDSITLAEFSSILTECFSEKITPDIFFSYPTISQLGKYLYKTYPNKMEWLYQQGDGMEEIIEEAEGSMIGEENSIENSLVSKKKKIAVVGMSGRFPGAKNVDEFWQLIKTGKEAISQVPKDRDEWWDGQQDSGHDYRMGFVSGIKEFDPLFFEIAPSEAETIDPKQRVILEEIWKALEDAGYGTRLLEEERIGVFVGAEDGDYKNILSEDTFVTSNNASMLSARIAYFLNLKGPNLTVNTACSSGLTAAHQAVLSLQNGECDSAIVAGVSLACTSSAYDSMEQAGMLAEDRRCRAFDRKASGMVPAEAAAVLILKKESKARHDGNEIYGIISGSGINYDGRTNGITAPSGESQKALLLSVYEQYHIDPKDIGLIMAHGTGTRLGDPIEMNALVDAFRLHTNRTGYCSVSSVKSNIGHSLAASGLVSVIALLKAMKEKILPPQINCEDKSEYIRWEDSPFNINETIKNWDVNDKGTRIGAVSAFGMGGTNVHFVLESSKSFSSVQEELPGYLLVISAKTEKALKNKCMQLADYLEDRQNSALMKDIAFTLLEGRVHFKHRYAVVVENRKEAIKKLREGSLHTEGVYQNRIKKVFKAQEILQNKVKTLSCVLADAKENRTEYYNYLHSLAEYFCEGYELDGRLFYGDGNYRRISLPEYPFEKDQCWVTKHRQSKEKYSRQELNKEGFIWINHSNLTEIKYEAVLDGSSFYFRDHIIENQAILPGVVYLELVQKAAKYAFGLENERENVVKIGNIGWLSPIVCEEKQKQSIYITLEEATQPELTFTIYTIEEDQTKSIKCQGCIDIFDKETDYQEDLQAIKDQTEEVYEAKLCYDKYQTQGMMYGESFQYLKNLYSSEDYVLSYLQMQESQNMDSYSLIPGMIDGALQSIMGFSLLEGADYLDAKVPFGLDEAIIYNPCKRNMWAIVYKGNRSGKVEKYDVDLFDEEGVLCVELRGYVSVTLPKDNTPTGFVMKREQIPVSFLKEGQKGKERVDICVGMWHVPEGIIHVPDAKYGSLLDKWYQEIFVDIMTQTKKMIHSQYQKAKQLQVVIPNNGKGKLLGAIEGFFRSVSKENPLFHGKLIEMEQSESAEGIKKILDVESNDTDNIHVVYKDGKRFVEQLSVVEMPQGNKKPWKNSGVYLITGGNGGLGRIFAKEVACSVDNPVLILVGRKESDEECDQFIFELEETGSTALYVSLDVTKKDEVESFIQKIVRRYGKIDGVLHCAGTNHDNYLLMKTEVEFCKTLESKVSGIIQIDQATKQLDLDFFISFSSITGVVGNAGQSDYAVANAFMDKYIVNRNQMVRKGTRKGTSVSIDWPLWKDGGMHVDEAYEKILANLYGMIPISINYGIELFYSIWSKIEEEPALENAICMYGKNSILQKEIGQLSKIHGNPIEPEEASVCLFHEEWVEEEWQEAIQEEQVIVCVAQDKTLMQSVQSELEIFEKKVAVIWVICNETYVKKSSYEYGIDYEQKEDYLQVFEEIKEDFGQVGSILYLNPLNDKIFLRDTSGIVSVLQAVAKTELKVKRMLIAGGYEDTVDRAYVDALIGMEKSCGNTILGLSIGVVIGDKREINSANFLHYLLKEIQSKQTESVWYDKGIRKVLAVKPIEKLETNDVKLRKNGTYIILGGMGGLGLIFANYLSKEYQANLVLSGRRSKEEVEVQLTQLKQSGMSVHYAQADVSNQVQLKLMKETAKKLFKKIDGVIHAAGLPEGENITRKDYEEFQNIIRPKVQGVIALDKVFQHENMDFICYFSSLSAVLGDIGSFDYAVGNRFMSYYGMHQSKTANYKVMVIQWPCWKMDGMHFESFVAESMYLKASSQVGLTEKKGTQIFEQVLGSTIEHCLVMYGNKGHIERNFGDYSDNITKYQPPIPAGYIPYTERKTEVVREEQAIQMDEVPEQQTTDPQTIEALKILKQILSKMLKISEDRIDEEDSMEEYGLNSIIILDLIKELEEVFGSLPKTIFYEYATLKELAEFFAMQYASVLKERKMQSGKSGIVGKQVTSDVSIATKTESRKPSLVRRVGRRVTKSEKEEKGTKENQDIAIIGLSGTYPKAKDMNTFWENLKEGLDCIEKVPEERWNNEAYHKLMGEKKTYSQYGGFIPDVDKFDSLFFRMSPREAERTDPQERLFLKYAYKAIEDAGYTKKQIEKISNVGVYVGSMYSEYQYYGVEEQMRGNMIAYTGTLSSIANRVSYFFNIHGPSLAVDTMCSSSLTAIYLACQEIVRGSCDMMIAGGVNLSIHPNKYVMLAQNNFSSSTGRCESFGEGGDGYVPSEGLGVVILKSLEKAIEDGDQIYGVIKAIEANHGGKTTGYSVPNPKAQTDVIVRALESTSINPETINYIEAHGTGTALGDPIEITALTNAYRKYTNKTGICRIGSVKSNIGHCEGAAGMSSLSKVLLQLKHKQIVPSIHSETLNPYINFGETPFQVSQQLKKWEPVTIEENGMMKEYPLRAGIQAFGAGGSNVHMIVEEYRNENKAEFNGPYGIVISAQTPEQVKELAKELLDWASKGIYTEADMAAIAYTLQIGREAMECRLAFCAEHIEELVEKLTAYINDSVVTTSGIYMGTIQEEGNDLAHLFSGEELTAITTQWMANGKLEKVLECWTKGMKVEWQELYQQEKPRKISLPTYPFVRKSCWVETKYDRIEEKKTDSKTKEPENDLSYIEEEWVPVEKIFEPVRTFKASDTILWIINQETKIEAIIQYVEAQKIQGTFLFVIRSSQYKQVSEEVYEVNFENSQTLLYGIQNIQKVRQTSLQYVIYWGADAQEYGPKRLPEIGYLYKALKEISSSPIKIVLAGRYKDEQTHSCIEALIGYVKSARMLMPKTKIALVGAEKQSITLEQFIQKTVETCIEDECPVQMLQNKVWMTNQLKECSLAAGESVLKQERVYFITGGLGGIGLLVAEWLLKQYHARVVLTGRSINDAKQKKLDELYKKYGERVQFIKADVCSEEDMKYAVQKAKENFGSLYGVIHAAGIEGKSSIYAAEDQEFLQVMAPKVQGTLVLNQVLENEAVEMICYFSSTSALLGDFGDCAYSTGNRFMMSYAKKQQNKMEETKAIYVLNWPLWREGGMGRIGESSVDMYLKSSGLRLLETKEALDCLEQVFCQKQVQIAVFAGDKKRIQEIIRPQTSQLKKPIVKRKSFEAIKMDGIEVKSSLLEMLKNNISELMKIDEELIGYETLLADYGFDSISLSEYADIINDEFRIEILPDTFFSYPTLLKLSDWLLKEHQEKIESYFQLPQLEVEEKIENPKIVEDLLEEPSFNEKQAVLAGNKESQSQDSEELIAVVGMSGRFPGADNIEQLWDILKEGKVTIDEVSEDRILWHEDSKVRKMGGLTNVYEFDPLFFEIPPSEAETMDPRQRLLLEESWKALEMAGYGEKLLEQEEIGVFVGAEDSTYGMVTKHAGGITSNHNAMMAARLAYFLDMKGPNMTINTACSSGLSAVHEACLSIRSGECDAAVAAGVNLFFTPESYDLMESAGMISPTQTCYAFDNRANGMVPGESVAVVVLKRLSLAIQDHNQILTVIKASGMNYDGRTNGITAPNTQSQMKLLASVYDRFQIDPENIGYVIAHGTGTKLGDPMEMNALTKVFEKYTGKKQYCAVGSIKPNIGHGLAASGVCSLIAMVLVLQNETILPQINCENESKYIQWKNSPFFLNTDPKIWKDQGTQKRIGAVSSFGMSGTNVHVVLESAKMYEQPRFQEQKMVHLLPLSAKTSDGLERMSLTLIEYLESRKETTNLDDVSYTLFEGRKHFLHRICAVASTREEAIEQLSKLKPEKVSRKFLKEEKIEAKIKQLEELYRTTEKEESLREIAEELMSYYNAGYSINGDRLYEEYDVARVTLPTYSFEHNEYNVEAKNYTSQKEGTSFVSNDLEIMSVYLGITDPPEGKIVLGRTTDEKEVSVLKNKMKRIIDVIVTSENPSEYGLHIIVPSESRHLFQFVEEFIQKATKEHPEFKAKIIFVPANSSKKDLIAIEEYEKKENDYQNVMYKNSIRSVLSET